MRTHDHYSHKKAECGYGELSPNEVMRFQLDAIAEACRHIMTVSKETDCPPETVALVVLMRGLMSNLEGGNEKLLEVLVRLFGRRVEAVPNPGALRIH